MRIFLLIGLTAVIFINPAFAADKKAAVMLHTNLTDGFNQFSAEAWVQAPKTGSDADKVFAKAASAACNHFGYAEGMYNGKVELKNPENQVTYFIMTDIICSDGPFQQ